MKIKQIFFLVLIVSAGVTAFASDKLPEQSHGISYPAGWQSWPVISVSHRIDNKTIRVIVGNEIAVQAARSGQTNPWPDGAVLGKSVWKEGLLENWNTAIVPKTFVHAEFMLKDSKKYSSTYGWGWARWVGTDLKPFNEGAQVCIECHTPVKSRDWVFTDPAMFPKP